MPDITEARAYLTDFVADPAALTAMPDADVLKYHGRVSGAVAKYAPKADGNKGPWYDSFQDPAVKDWVKSYGDAYQTPEAMALKAFNMERFLGADKAGRGIVLPGSNAKPEEWLPIWRKLGAQEKIDGYKLPEGWDKDPFTVKLREQAHKIGMPTVFFDGMMNAMREEATARTKLEDEQFNVESEKQHNEVKTLWGDKYDANVELGRRAASAIIPHKTKEELEETLLRIEGALGTKFTLEMWARIGGGMGEHQFVQSDGPSGSGGMTPEAARLRIAALKKDPEFGKKLTSGDASSKEEWTKLHRIGYPDTTETPQF